MINLFSLSRYLFIQAVWSQKNLPFVCIRNPIWHCLKGSRNNRAQCDHDYVDPANNSVDFLANQILPTSRLSSGQIMLKVTYTAV